MRGGGGVKTCTPRRLSFWPLAAVLATVAAVGQEPVTVVDQVAPMFPAAADQVRQGFVRIINHSPRAGDVRIEAYDDGGTRFGPVTLDIDADETVHFNSADLEASNAAKGLAVGTGPGVGDWWLALSSDLDIEVLSYIRTPDDGFLTSMHDVVPPDVDGDYRVAIFNPGSNTDQVSRLRPVNAGEQAAEVTITGVDDRCASPGGEVRVSVPAGAARTLAADELESGTGRQGVLGDGTGKWELRVESDRPVLVMSLLLHGHVPRLGRAVDDAHEALPPERRFSDGDARHGAARGKPAPRGDLQSREQSLKGADDIVELLIEAGADVNHPLPNSVAGANSDLSGATPLMIASANGHLDVVRLLVVAGANVSYKVPGKLPSGERVNRKTAGKNALKVARGKNHHELAKFLKQQ